MKHVLYEKYIFTLLGLLWMNEKNFVSANHHFQRGDSSSMEN